MASRENQVNQAMSSRNMMRQGADLSPTASHQQPVGESAGGTAAQTRDPLEELAEYTFAGTGSNWRAYTQREADAYHGLLQLRYGPVVVEEPTQGNNGPAQAVNVARHHTRIPQTPTLRQAVSRNIPAQAVDYGRQDTRTRQENPLAQEQARRNPAQAVNLARQRREIRDDHSPIPTPVNMPTPQAVNVSQRTATNNTALASGQVAFLSRQPPGTVTAKTAYGSRRRRSQQPNTTSANVRPGDSPPYSTSRQQQRGWTVPTITSGHAPIFMPGYEEQETTTGIAPTGNPARQQQPKRASRVSQTSRSRRKEEVWPPPFLYRTQAPSGPPPQSLQTRQSPTVPPARREQRSGAANTTPGTAQNTTLPRQQQTMRRQLQPETPAPGASVPNRYSCYMCNYVARRVYFVERHMERVHNVMPSEVDSARIEASKVECLW